MEIAVFTFTGIPFEGSKQSVDIDLNWDRSKKVLSISGGIWDHYKRDYIRCGQIQDELKKIPELMSKRIVQRLMRLWDLYHLNDLHAGIPEQEAFLKHEGLLNADQYTQACERLQQVHLYEIPAEKVNPYRDKPSNESYKYGTSWLKWPIPYQDIQEIEDVLSIGQMKKEDANG